MVAAVLDADWSDELEEEVEEVAEELEEESAYGVADQPFELTVDLALVSVVVLEEPVLSVAVAVVGAVESAMLPPKPSSAATLPAAATFRARCAG